MAIGVTVGILIASYEGLVFFDSILTSLIVIILVVCAMLTLTYADTSSRISNSSNQTENVFNLEAIKNNYGLTPREAEVLNYLIAGRSASYIANACFISVNTAKTHIKHIYMKMDVQGKQEMLNLINLM